MSGLQPSCSNIIADTQAAGLGFLIVRRWRGGKHASPLARQIGQRPFDTVRPPDRSVDTRAPSPPPFASIRDSPPVPSANGAA